MRPYAIYKRYGYATKILKKELKQVLKGYLQGNFEASLQRLKELKATQLDTKSYEKLRRVLDILLIGELYGLHTLKQILRTFGIKSTNYYKLWQDFRYHQIKRWSISLCVDYFKAKLKVLMGKSDSTWSRTEVTIVVDDSIFKQWLKNMPRGHYYDCFFSGQVGRAVYGFRVTLIGVALGDDFYPLYFQFVPKGGRSKKVALKLLNKVRAMFKQLSDKEGFKYPNLFLSVDSGFTDTDLIKYCERVGIGFIGVPKKNYIFGFGEQKMNLNNYIEQVFLPQEAAYMEAQKANGVAPEPFTFRVRANFKSQNREVVLLFFRLNNSQKVTVIFCQQIAVMGKTLRRRFFQRTKIELFFRFLKDTLKIQKSKTERFGDFTKKLSLYLLKAMVCLQFVQYCRTKKRFKGWAFSKLRHHIIYQQVDMDLLKNAVFDSPFA